MWAPSHSWPTWRHPATSRENVTSSARRRGRRSALSRRPVEEPGGVLVPIHLQGGGPGVKVVEGGVELIGHDERGLAAGAAPSSNGRVPPQAAEPPLGTTRRRPCQRFVNGIVRAPGPHGTQRDPTP